MARWKFAVVDLNDPALPKDPRQITHENGGLAFCDDWRDVRACLRYYSKDEDKNLAVKKHRWKRSRYWRTHLRRHI